MDNILVNQEELSNIISKLELKIKSLEDIQEEIENKVSIIDGSSDVWSSDTQKKAYDKYRSITKEFLNSIVKIKALKIFLQNTLDNYSNSDEKLNDSIENNKDNLDIN